MTIDPKDPNSLAKIDQSILSKVRQFDPAETQKVISTSKGEGENPFHKPISQPLTQGETTTVPKLQDTSKLAEKIRSLQLTSPAPEVQPKMNDGYRNYWQTLAPQPETQQTGSETKPATPSVTIRPDLQSKLDQLKNKSSHQENAVPNQQSQEVKPQLQGDYSPKPEPSDAGTTETAKDSSNI